ncbi:MAG: hypothetical protein QM756_27930 [Polyangiaceae bacterium]
MLTTGAVVEPYKPSLIRLLAARLHGSMMRGGQRFERFTDSVAVIAGGLLMLTVIALVGFIFLPVTGTWFDFVLWLAFPIVVTLAIAALARASRRRRHGASAATKPPTALEILTLASGAWFGLLMIGLAVAILLRGEPISGSFACFVLLGAFTLVLCAVEVYRYVTRP